MKNKGNLSTFALIAALGGASGVTASVNNFTIEETRAGINVTFNGSPHAASADPAWADSSINIISDVIGGWWRFNNSQIFILNDANGHMSDWACVDPFGIYFYSADANGQIPAPHTFHGTSPNDVTTTAAELVGGNTFNAYVPGPIGGQEVLFTVTLKSLEDVADVTSTAQLLIIPLLVLAGFTRRLSCCTKVVGS